MQTQQYHAKKAVATISNAMDVGNPSNFVRILEIFHHKFVDLQQILTSFSISDAETKAILKSVYNKEGYLLDPHGAVGYHALKQYQQHHTEQKGIVLETAHPVKFYDVVEPVIGEKVPVPASIEEQLKLEKNSILLEAAANQLKAFLMKNA